MPSRTTAMQKQIYDFFLNCNGKFFFSAPPTTPTVETQHAVSPCRPTTPVETQRAASP